MVSRCLVLKTDPSPDFKEFVVSPGANVNKITMETFREMRE